MRLTCPSCGAIASLEAWFNDADTKEALMAILAFPPEIAKNIPAYLAFFRPEEHALPWRRVCSLVAVLRGLINAPTITQGHKHPLPNSVTWWRSALEQVAAQRGQVKRPLANHNYLRTIAYAAAEAAEAKAEQRQGQDARSPFNDLRAPAPIRRPIDPEVRNRVKEEVARAFERTGRGGDSQSLGEILGGRDEQD